MSELNAKQKRALALLQEIAWSEEWSGSGKKSRTLVRVPRQRHLYQAMYLDMYCITYTGDLPDAPTLSADEAHGLVAAAGLVPSYPDTLNVQCWQIAAQLEARAAQSGGEA